MTVKCDPDLAFLTRHVHVGSSQRFSVSGPSILQSSLLLLIIFLLATERERNKTKPTTMGLLHIGDDDTSLAQDPLQRDGIVTTTESTSNSNNGSVTSNTNTILKTCLLAGCIFSFGLLAGRGLDNKNNNSNNGVSSMMEDLPGYNGSGDEELLKPYVNDELPMDIDNIMDETTLDIAPIIDWEMIKEEENQPICKKKKSIRSCTIRN
jgi:hypothetical protein